MGNSPSSSTQIVTPECAVCSSTIDVANSVSHLRCRFSHFLCQSCATNYIKVTWMKKPFDVGAVPEVECCHPNCGIVFREHQIAQAVDEETFQAYLDRKMSARDGMVLANMRQHLASLTPDEMANQAEMDRQVLAKQLRAQLAESSAGNFLQCPRCRFGPIEVQGCFDLQLHHGERQGGSSAQTKNSCPQCDFFARDRNQWDKWDGVLRDPNDYKNHQQQQTITVHRSLFVGLMIAWMYVAWQAKWVAVFATVVGIFTWRLAHSIATKEILQKGDKTK